MPENAFKNTTSWTEEHDIFCLRHSIPPSAQYLWRWLIRQGEINKEVEPDLSEFNTWVESNRGESYDQPYLKEMFQLLQSHRVIQVIKEFSWKVYRLIVRPLSWLNPPKKRTRKNSNSLDYSPKVEPSNAPSAEQGLNSSSNSSTHISTEEFQELERQHDILKACADYEIYFDPNKASTRHLFEFDIDYIRQALKHFVKRGGHKEITNPQGWLIDCLRDCYWQDELFGLSGFIEVLKSWFPNNLPRDY